MRVLDHWTDRKQPRLHTLLVATTAGDGVDLFPGDQVTIPELGSCLIVKARPVDSPEPRLLPGERVFGLDVQAPDIR